MVPVMVSHPLTPRPTLVKAPNEVVSHEIPSPFMAALFKPICWLVVRELLSRWVGNPVVRAVVSSFHQFAVFPVPTKSGEAEKSKSKLGELVPHVVMGIRRLEGGVCKAERAALEAAEEPNDSPILSPNGLPPAFGTPMEGDACGVN